MQLLEIDVTLEFSTFLEAAFFDGSSCFEARMEEILCVKHVLRHRSQDFEAKALNKESLVRRRWLVRTCQLRVQRFE